MSDVLETANHEIHLNSCKVTYKGEDLKIRTKTFLLLKFLVESAGLVVSKQQILDEVWQDVVTDDQVIFQSIKELRKIFDGIDVIKTYPRKGYAWVPPVSSKMHNDTPAKSQQSSIFTTINRKSLFVSLGILLLITAFGFLANNQYQPQSSEGSVVILPVVNELTNGDHQWVRLGVMDQVIHRLPSSTLYGVLQTDDVLAVMKRAQLPAIDLKREDMDSIFAVSGATLIVASNLSGNVNDYQLIYNLHRRNGIERGVILGENITVMANQLAALVGKKIDLNLTDEDITYHSDFANEMLAAALNKINNQEYSAAKILLTAAKEIEPNNLVVSRHLAQMLIINNQLEEAQENLHKAIAQAQIQDNKRELARLHTILSQSYLRAGNPTKAIDILMSAQRNAKAVNDWLYLGYIASTRGKAYQFSQRFTLAAEAFESAINYHKVIQCPFGQAQGFIALAELALSQGERENAQQQIERSLAIIEERGLSALKETALEVSQMINPTKA